MKHLPLLLLAAFGVTLPLSAQMVAQWNFNSVPSDGSASTGTLEPSWGAGSASTVGGATGTFSTGNANGGSSDPDPSANDSAWNISGFAAQGTGSGTRGVEFRVPTVGWESGPGAEFHLSWDQRNSGTASRYVQFQYTVDGATFLDWGTPLASTVGDTWYNQRSVSLNDPAAFNNPEFGFRLVSVFAPGTAGYQATGDASNYGPSGTWRLDAVSVNYSGFTAVPEPGEYALLFSAGLGAFALWRRRRPTPPVVG